MVFTKDSYLVQLFVMNIKKGIIAKENVPNLFNLREVVFSILDEEQTE